MTTSANTPTGRVLVAFEPTRIVPFRFEGFVVAGQGVTPEFSLEPWESFTVDSPERDTVRYNKDGSARYTKVHYRFAEKSVQEAYDHYYAYEVHKDRPEHFPSLADVYGPDQYHLATEEAWQYNLGCKVTWYEGFALDDKGNRFAHSFFRVRPNYKVLFRDELANASGEPKEDTSKAALLKAMLKLLHSGIFGHLISTQHKLAKTAKELAETEVSTYIVDALGAPMVRGKPTLILGIDDSQESTTHSVRSDVPPEAYPFRREGRIRHIKASLPTDAWDPTPEQVTAIATTFMQADEEPPR